MKLLLDSNVLLRWSDSRAPEYAACAEAVTQLAQQGHTICVCAQVIIESYVVATRPVEVNGLGFTAVEARQTLADIEESFPCLPEPSDMASQWRNVIETHSVVGKQAHDARLVALMQAHGINHIVTLNAADFSRYQTVTTITPAEVLSQ